MEFRTPIQMPAPGFQIEPLEEMLFVGSCFADSIGQRFVEDKFRATVNPYGTMYNPVSVLHTVERLPADCRPRVVFLTLGTNHVYRLRETGEVVDNCQKRPQRLFQEEQLSVDECADALARAVGLLQQRRADVHVVLTVSPIRYRKYGYHESQLSKATLLLAVDRLISHPSPLPSHLSYFPAYEIVLDELRDYRFYAPDMLHPSEQAVGYIWECLAKTYFSPATVAFLEEWHPLKAALNHRPFHPDSADHRAFMARTQQQLADLARRYPGLAF